MFDQIPESSFDLIGPQGRRRREVEIGPKTFVQPDFDIFVLVIT